MVRNQSLNHCWKNPLLLCGNLEAFAGKPRSLTLVRIFQRSCRTEYVNTSPIRWLGLKGPQATALGFGAPGLSTFYGKPEPDEERFGLLDYAQKSGGRD